MPGKKSETKYSVVPPQAAPAKKADSASPLISGQKAEAGKPAASTSPSIASAAPVAVAVAAQPAVVTAVVAVPKPAAVDNQVAIRAKVAELRSRSADVARDAAAALGDLGDVAAVEPLIEVISDSEGFFHSVVRAAAAESLGKLRDARATLPLIAAIDDSMVEASAESIRALAAIKDPRAVKPLLDVVRNVQGFFLPVARRAALLALAQLGGAEAIAELKAVAADAGEDPVLRDAAREASN